MKDSSERLLQDNSYSGIQDRGVKDIEVNGESERSYPPKTKTSPHMLDTFSSLILIVCIDEHILTLHPFIRRDESVGLVLVAILVLITVVSNEVTQVYHH